MLFRQVRVSRHGRRFEILKFRTFENGNGGSGGFAPTWSSLELAGEQPASRLARYLRRSSLDELPQLFNVLRGDMSLVGPRPERPELVDLFEREIPGYRERHRVRVGITGWAQIQGVGRGDTRFSRQVIAERARLDNYYIDNWSLRLDAKIFVSTWRALFRFSQNEQPVSTSRLELSQIESLPADASTPTSPG